MPAVTVPDALIERIRSAQRFLITSHLNPDGDAVGTSIGMARLLRRLGKVTQVWLHDPVPPVFAPLIGNERIHQGPKAPPGFPDSYDCAIVLECPEIERCGIGDSVRQLPILNIDHHLGNAHYGTANWVDSAAPAVGEMACRLAATMHIELDAETATALYLALSTDTGGFRFANATQRAFEAAAELTRQGAEPERVAKWLYESRTLASVKLLGETLQGLKLHGSGRIATVIVTQPMYSRCSATHGDTEGLIDYPRSIEGVDVSALVRQLEGGGFKVSLRSRGAIDVESVARRHGGGGHHNAAGFSLEGDDPESARESVAEELEALLGGGS